MRNHVRSGFETRVITRVKTWLRFACAIFATAAGAAAAAPNILYILADDMGVGDVSCLNPKSIWQTPQIDRLAREGMTFTDAHSSSGLCTPTRYTLLTGRHSWRSTLKRGVLNGYSPSLIEPGRLTLPAFLRAQGYTTAMFGKWHLGLDWAKSGAKPEDVDFTKRIGGGPTERGFDRYFGISASLDMPPYVWIENDRVTALPSGTVGDSPAPKLWRAGPIGADFKMEDVQPRLIEKTLGYLAERANTRDGKPFFIYLALASPHTPILPKPPFAGKTKTPYGDFVSQIDADVGKLLAALERHGFTRNTLVIFTTDNGYAPAGNIPKHAPLGHDSSAGFRGTKSDVYEGGHRVPFIARWPGVTPAGSRCTEVIGQLDLFATCAELLGATLPDNAAEDSSSMLALLRGQAAPASRRSFLVHHSADGEFAIREGRWKLILCPGSGGWSPPTKSPSPWTQPKADSFEGLPPFQLYDMTADPGETRNLAAEQPEVVQRLGRLMRRTIDRGRSTPGAVQPNAAGPWPQIAWREKFAPSATVAGEYAGEWRRSPEQGGELRLKLTHDGTKWSADASFIYESAPVPCTMRAIEVDGLAIQLIFDWTIDSTPGQSTIKGVLNDDTFEGTYETRGQAGESSGTWKVARVAN